MRQRVLITGSSGMLGIDLCAELCNSYELYGIDSRRVQGSGSRVSLDFARDRRGTAFRKCDITKKEAVEKIIKKIKPDVVIHAAAWTDVDGCEMDPEKAYAVNAKGAENVALACKKIGAILVYISTDFVFDGKKKKPYREPDRPRPLSIYADSKLRGEEAVKKILKRYCILRTSWLYGKQGKNFVDTIIAKAKTEKALKVVDDQIGSPTYTKDFAKAIHALIDRVQGPGSRVKETGIYHVSNTGATSWYEYARTILKLTGSKTKVLPITSRELARPARRPAFSVLDNAKFVRYTSYRMRSWREALKDYLQE